MKTRLQNDHWLLKNPIAHRGLHGKNVAENSLSAFEKAIDKGFPIETDIQMSKDGVLFCFHDDNVVRMTGLNADIREIDSEKIIHLNLLTTDEHIPTFKDLLLLVQGRVPLLIEVKRQKQKGIEGKILKELVNYKGEYAIQSFDPIVLKNFKNIAPEIIRGQLSDAISNEKNLFVRHIIKKMNFNFLIKPDFCNVNLKGFNTSKKYAKGLPMLCWTVRTSDDKRKAEQLKANYVFENVFE